MASELVGGLAYPWSIVEKQKGLDQRGKEAASAGLASQGTSQAVHFV